MRIWKLIKSKFYIFNSLRIRIFLSFIILFIIILLISNTVSYLISTQQMKQLRINEDQQLMGSLNNNIDNLLMDLDGIAKTLSANSQIQAILERTTASQIEEYQDYNTIKNIYNELAFARKEVSSIFIYSYISKKILYNNPSMSINEEVNIEDQSWYKKLKEGRIKKIIYPANWQYYYKYPDEQVISIIRNVYDFDTFKAIGIVKVDCVISTLNNILKNNTNSISLFDSDNNPIVSKTDIANKEIMDALNEHNGSLTRVVNGKKLFITYIKSDYSGWKILKVSDYSMLTRDSDLFRTVNIITLSGSIIGCIIVSLLISKGITLPVKNLIKKMKGVQEQIFDTYQEITSLNEFKELNQGFNAMVIRMRQLIIDEYKIKLAEKESQLLTLQNQINPHFLYNTLESIRVIAAMNKDHTSAEMLFKLANLYRYITKTHAKLVKLKDEIEYIDNYVDLQKMRFGDRFQIIFKIGQGAGQIPVPKLILQPFVENCIIHGFKNQREKGEISVLAEITEQYLTIEIEDNGVGITENNLSIIRLRLQNEVFSNESIGISNVFHRMKYYYGEKFVFNINSSEGCGTAIRMVIPIEK